MPLIQSAKKKMRKDRKRTAGNALYIKSYKNIFNKIKKGGSGINKLISQFYSRVDKAVKRKVIHKNKGNRLKSRVNKLLKKK